MTTMMRRLVLPFALFAVGAAVFMAAPAATARAGDPEGGIGVVVRSVNSMDPSKVTVVFEYGGDPADVRDARVTEAGNQMPLEQPPVAVPESQRGVMFVLDASASTDGSAVLAEAQEAVAALAAKLPGVPLGLVSAGAQATLDQRFTTEASKFDAALRSVDPNGDGAVWEAVVRAVGQFNGEDMLPTIVLVTDGVQQPGTSFSEARSAVSNAGAQVHVVGLQRGGLGSDARSLAEDSGGAYVETANPAALTDTLQQLTTRLVGQYRLTYASGVESGLAALALTVGDGSSRNSFVPGSVQRGVTALAYEEPSSGGAGLFGGEAVKYLGLALALVAAGLGAFAVINLLIKDENALATVLRPYDTYAAPDADDEPGASQSLATSALLQRAVAMTEEFAHKQGVLSKVEGALERANLPIRAAEAMFFYAAAVVLFTLLVGVLTRQVLVAGLVLGASALLPPAIINLLAGRRKKQFEALLPDMLQLMSATLRAGYSMQQAMDAVAQEVAEPMGRELRRATTEARLGRPLEDALDSIADRMASKDFAWAVMAIRIQREVGGNLAELLMTVGDTMTQRERLRREVRALTAEGRMSAYVLGILPIGLAGILWTINPEYMQALTDKAMGQIILGMAALGMVGGFVWMNKIVKVEI